MNQIQRKRAKRFANWLSKLKTSNFNIGNVCNVAGSTLFKDDKKKEFSCGTSACAIGHLILYNPKVFSYDGKYLNIKMNGISRHYLEVAKLYFGFNDNQSEVFYPGYHYQHIENRSDITPQVVAEKINEVLEGKIK